MTKISVSSCICDSIHTITGRVEGDRIIVQIDTLCEKFRESNCLEFPLNGLPENQSNLILEMEGQIGCSFKCTRECALDCTRQCLIPPAVLNVCSIEYELAKKKLAESVLAESVLAEPAFTEPALKETSFLETPKYTSSEIQ